MEKSLLIPTCVWFDAPKMLTLNREGVHVWRASLNLNDRDAVYMRRILSLDEKERSKRFHFQKDKDRFIASRGVLRVILGRYLGIEPDTLKFRIGTYGKPFLSEDTDKDIKFSVSHSHGLALFAFSCSAEIGVDIEYVDQSIITESLVEQVCSQNEINILNDLLPYQRQKIFFSIWTRKEALLKAMGTGLMQDMKLYDVLTNRINAAWSLGDIDAYKGYSAAIAVMGHEWKLKCFQY